MPRVVLSPLAKQDIDEIGDYIAQDNLTAAMQMSFFPTVVASLVFARVG